MQTTTAPRIYVTCLAAYNEGKLHGEWIEATQDAADIHEAIAAMLKASPVPNAEEWAIHDFEGFGSFRFSESEGIETVAALAQAIDEHGAIIAELHAHLGNEDVENTVDYMGENYAGAWDSLEAFAENMLEDCGDLNAIPENLRYYFDFEKYARDLELGGDVFTLDFEGETHVFWNR